MPRLAAALVPVLLTGLHCPIGAQETDPIRAELSRAKKAHADADTKAKTSLRTSIDDAIKAVAGTGDLDAVKALQADMKAFEESGKVPDSPRLRAAATEYSRATKAAQAALEKAFDKAVKDATRSLNIDLAEAIQAEWKEALGKGAKPGPVTSDAPTRNQKWIVGTFRVVHHPNLSTRTYVVKPSGEVEFVESKLRGQLKPYTAGSFTLDFGEGKFQRITFADGRMFEEHFNPKSDFEKNPPGQIGIGELVKKK
jgi:hypothetical protein